MPPYSPPNPKLWYGRNSNEQLYLHEKVILRPLSGLKAQKDNAFALLGYCCDEGVRRNQGRTGATDGPDAIRKALSKMPNHLPQNTLLFDAGNIQCVDADMETTQDQLAEGIFHLLEANVFPLLLGGGHDIAYGHYKGIKIFFDGTHKTLGILNFDAHFDLRQTYPENHREGGNSGTPFFQIAQECKSDGVPFQYMCLGIRKDANTRFLYQTAHDFGVQYIEIENFNLRYLESIKKEVLQFMQGVDCVYTTIDLDGFSSAYAPGVSAASPMGFSPDIVLEILKIIIDSKKLISLDIAEMNPLYDMDQQTAKLAASLLHFVMHR